VAGGETRNLHAGDFVAVMPAGNLVEMIGHGFWKYSWAVGGKGDPAQRAIPPGQYRDPSSGIRNGKLAAPLASFDPWFDQLGVLDLATGRMTRIPVDFQGDYHFESGSGRRTSDRLGPRVAIYNLEDNATGDR
jgi:hypothetical protein